MKNKLRHVLGISGGKDSAALAIYLKYKYPELNIEYYFCETGKELQETYDLLGRLERYLGKKIIRVKAVDRDDDKQFDHFLDLYGGFLPSSNARWCTKKLKLEPFEKFVGNDPVVSYVGIRGDENRDGYISKKTNIQSIFPFRRNIWSEDIISKILNTDSLDQILAIFKIHSTIIEFDYISEILNKDSDFSNQRKKIKLNALLDINIKVFNKTVFEYLKDTRYPLSLLDDFCVLDNDDNLIREDIFNILNESGVGMPEYYKKIEFEVKGKKGHYARSRSGCFFCFFQQKIEWIWLYEQHPGLFKRAIKYEKAGYSWMDNETLEDIIKPERIERIKEDYLKVIDKENNKKSPYLLDILEDEEDRCVACFV
jgi:Phosphoadenosine phosphosulfate reductase family